MDFEAEGSDRRRPGLSRNGTFLVVLTAVASVALVASAAVLMMLHSPGDFSMTPPVAKVTSHADEKRVTTAAPAPITAPPGSSATTSVDTPTTAAASASTPSPSRAGAAGQPHTGISRNPMSFHPTPGAQR